MEKKLTRHTTEEALLHARQENLDHVHELTSMKAHGKVYGMDTFSWMNPPMEPLMNVLGTFPFSVVWLAGHEQVMKGAELNIAIHEKLDSLIIYDRGNLELEPSLTKEIKTVLCVNDLNSALDFVKAMEKKKMVFLFTAHGEEVQKNETEFENWIRGIK